MMFKIKDPNSSSQNSTKNAQQKKYTPINSYKPQGNLVYDDELLSKLEDKFN